MKLIIDRMIDRIDEILIPFLQRWSLPLLRWSIAIVFIWFGGLKVVGHTDVTELVGGTVYWVNPDWFVPFLGAVEVAIGIGLAVGRARRLVLLALLGQMVGTFLVFVTLPEVAFHDGNPLLLTVVGQYVVKNIVIIAAAMAMGARIPTPRSKADPQSEELQQSSA